MAYPTQVQSLCKSAIERNPGLEITLTDEARARLKAQYTGCLCRECLSRYQESSPQATSVENPIERR
jgi:hypothetical protein